MLKHSLTTQAPVRPSRLRFCVLSADEIERMSVVEVTESTIYYRGLPASGGLLDPLMGTVDRRHLCASCMRDARTCQGHCGHIALAFPVYHLGFIDTVLKALRTTCFCCSRVCVTADEAAALERDRTEVTASGRSRERLGALHGLVRTRRTCPHCNAPRPTYARTPLGISVEWADDTPWESDEEREYCTQPFTAREALSVLRHMPPDDVRLLGFDPNRSHPMHMVLQNMVVPPPCTRPAVYSSEGSRSRGQNDLTARLGEVLKRSQDVATALRVVTGDPPSRRPRWDDATLTPDVLGSIERLQYEVFLVVNSNVRAVRPQGMGRCGGSTTMKSLSDRVRGKEGRIRGNLMGKRVDFSARCVITPDAYFDCDVVGVPHRIAMGLTVPERVNVTNVRVLGDRVRRGAKSVHGAANVLHRDGTTTDLAHCPHRDDIALRPGDIVERYLADDDVVVFNRQPSLHLHGMMAHRVRVMPGYTFRLSLPVAAPYNADFDGDEMNLHVPQSRAAVAECAALMGVAQNIIGPQSNRPVVGVVQDSLLGLHVLTLSRTLLDRAHVCRLVGTTKHATRTLPPPAVRVVTVDGRERALWTGRQVASMLLPPELHLGEPPAEGTRADDAAVCVRNGRILCGVLSKAHVGTSAGGVVDVLCRTRGPVACMRFMGDAQRLTHAFLLQHGHHVGIKDVMLSADGHERVQQRLRKVTRLCDEIQREALASPQLTTEAENGVMRLLSKTLLQTGGIVEEQMDADNAFRLMFAAGSKGSFVNLSQICACLGQQTLEGTRLHPDARSRTLPAFAANDTSLASRGFVVNSFALGLAPTELFHHAIGGREGLVDTAVKTSQTGYLQRRMNKSVEDHVVAPDGTVRNALGDVIAFRWGSDGMHPARVERVTCPALCGREDAVRARFTDEEWPGVREARNNVLSVRAGPLATEVDARVLLPFNPARVHRALHAADEPSEEDALCVIAAEARRFADSVRSAVVSLAVRDTFAVGRLRGAAPAVARTVLADVRARIAEAEAAPGDAVGCIAAQSIGQPCTQLTLNTFHTAGVGSRSVSMGIPRLKELLDASRNCRTPCTTLRLRAPYATTETCARALADTLPLTRLGDIVKATHVVRGGVQPDTLALMSPDEREAAQRATHVLHFDLDDTLMRTRCLAPPMVRRVLAERLGARAVVSATETNTVAWHVRVTLLDVDEMLAHGQVDADCGGPLCHRVANTLLETVVVAGHPNVQSAEVAVMSRVHADGQTTTEHVVHAYGADILGDVAASACVDWARSSSNNLWEVYHALGIEACARVLFEQVRLVLSFDGGYVDDRHLMVVVDTICRNGTLMPLNRHGINRTDASPLMRCSFEETMDVLCDAAAFSESENARGVTTAIMTGQLASMGTGRVGVALRRERGETTALARTAGRVLRSTRRSHAAPVAAQCMEYVVEKVRPGVARPMSPPCGARKRARFRHVSPPRA